MNASTPTLAGYSAFLYGPAGIKPAALPALFTGAGTLVAGDTTLTIVTRQTGQLAAGVTVIDANGALGSCGDVILQQLTGTPGAEGTYQLESAASTDQATAELIIAPNPALLLTFAVALETVNSALAAGCTLYALAVYNLAVDRLINFAQDTPGQTYFADLRARFKLLEPTVGVVSSGSDQGTSGSVMNSELLRALTMEDLQTLKTPNGRTYMGIAQAYGPTLWGMS